MRLDAESATLLEAQNQRIEALTSPESQRAVFLAGLRAAEKALQGTGASWGWLREFAQRWPGVGSEGER